MSDGSPHADGAQPPPVETFTLRIVSDGTPAGTKILDGEGRRLKHVKAVAWGLDVNGFARIALEVVAVPADLIGQVRAGEDVTMLSIDQLTPDVEVAVPQQAPTADGNGPVPPPPDADVVEDEGWTRRPKGM